MANFCHFCGCHHNPVEECTGGHVFPHYPICDGCDLESDDATGWCSRCEQYADGRLADEPLSELRRTGTGGYWS